MKPLIASNVLDKIALIEGWEIGLVTKQNHKENNNPKFAFQTYNANHAPNKEELERDAIYFSGTTPVIYIKQLASYNPSKYK